MVDNLCIEVPGEIIVPISYHLAYDEMADKGPVVYWKIASKFFTAEFPLATRGYGFPGLSPIHRTHCVPIGFFKSVGHVHDEVMPITVLQVNSTARSDGPQSSRNHLAILSPSLTRTECG